MALGGGIFTSMNKIMPGSYINYVSAARASSALSDRGVAALPLELNWGADDTVIEVTKADLEKDSLNQTGNTEYRIVLSILILNGMNYRKFVKIIQMILE